MGLKECPVCHARCFDDMDVCYGCLHSFSREAADSSPAPYAAAGPASAGLQPVDRGGEERVSLGFDVAEGHGVSAVGASSVSRAPVPAEAVCDVAARSAAVASPSVDVPAAQDGTSEVRAASASRLVHVLDIVIGIRMAQDAADRAATTATLPVWVERTGANEGWIVSEG